MSSLRHAHVAPELRCREPTCVLLFLVTHPGCKNNQTAPLKMPKYPLPQWNRPGPDFPYPKKQKERQRERERNKKTRDLTPTPPPPLPQSNKKVPREGPPQKNKKKQDNRVTSLPPNPGMNPLLGPIRIQAINPFWMVITILPPKTSRKDGCPQKNKPGKLGGLPRMNTRRIPRELNKHPFLKVITAVSPVDLFGVLDPEGILT